ncbi:RBBP9/YdeN family alpha/beta hydrolase, partial [Isoptericola sp. NPDC056134]|uniref:RBBP9/YdeN family alpha/beta hydrolase n=1 Tax=Isoptericola sp. NPDC056134 TaxID=3345723 RepID=UPI0035EC856E
MSIPQRVIVIHGYGADPDSHWFPWLTDQLGPENVTIPPMPDPSNPDAATWVEIATKAIADADENTVIIGHSLGGITALRGIAAQSPAFHVAGIIIVAGFAEHLPGYAALDPFTSDRLDIEALRSVSPNRSVFVADIDPVLDTAIVERLATRLGANLIEVAGAGHFQADDGITALPEILNVIREIPG